MKKLFGMLCVLALVGCNEISGQLDVKEALTLKLKKGETLQIQPGVQTVGMSADGSRFVLQTFNAGKKVKVPFKITGANGDNFESQAGANGQDYSVLGRLSTTQNSRVETRTENCTMQGPNGGSIPGTRRVTQRITTTYTQLNAKINGQNGQIVATASAAETSSFAETLSAEECALRIEIRW